MKAGGPDRCIRGKQVKLAMEGILNYAGHYRRPSRCDIRVYRAGTEAEKKAGRLPVLIATERDDNPGTSVTDRIEVIERYVENALVGGTETVKETFDLVTFTWTRCQGAIGPRWTPLTKAQVEEILTIHPP